MVKDYKKKKEKERKKKKKWKKIYIHIRGKLTVAVMCGGAHGLTTSDLTSLLPESLKHGWRLNAGLNTHVVRAILTILPLFVFFSLNSNKAHFAFFGEM